MTSFLRNELGFKGLLTDQNFIQSPNVNAQRIQYDYVDNHIYWDHPRPMGNGLVPVGFINESVLANGLMSPRLIMPSRVFGKPFFVTEYDFCFPNRFRSEGAPVFSAYAALQDWDAIYRFDYSCGARRHLDEVSIEPFDVANDTVRMLSERIAAAFFVRSDIRPSVQSFVSAVPEDVATEYWNDYPNDNVMAGLISKVGSVQCDVNGGCTPSLPPDTRAVFALSEKSVPSGLSLPVFIGFKNNNEAFFKAGLSANTSFDRIESDTGELAADLKRHTFQAVNERSEALVVPEGDSLEGRLLHVRGTDTFTTVAAISVDGQPLKSSGRILLLHLTDVQLEGLTFRGRDMKIVDAWPRGQLLGLRGRATITLDVTRRDLTLYALNARGERLAKVECQRNDDGISFEADTFCVEDDVVFAYELTAE